MFGVRMETIIWKRLNTYVHLHTSHDPFSSAEEFDETRPSVNVLACARTYLDPMCAYYIATQMDQHTGSELQNYLFFGISKRSHQRIINQSVLDWTDIERVVVRNNE
jgi:hypothetical protein